MRVRVFFAALVVLALATKAALAAGPNGLWRMNDGTTFTVAEIDGEILLVKTSPNGAKELRVARWVDGMQGTQFKYSLAQGGECILTFNGADPNHLQALCAGHPYPWNRQGALKGGSHSFSGKWRAADGLVMVLMETPQGLDAIWTAPNGQRNVVATTWVQGMEGTQFSTPSFTYTRNASNPNVIMRAGMEWKRVSVFANTAPRPAAQPAATGGAPGVWLSSLGDQWVIPQVGSGAFDVGWRAGNGRSQSVFRAAWAPGLEGTQMNIRTSQEVMTCTYSARNPDRFVVRHANGAQEIWTRAR